MLELVQSLTLTQAVYYKCSRSRGQRSRSQHDVIGAKFAIISNSDGDCSISIKFTTDYDHVTPDLPQAFKVSGSKVEVIAWHDVLASKNLYIL